MDHRVNNDERSGLAYILRALRSRNYRLYFIGQGLSLIGSWMTRVATSWLVYRLTNSALVLGVVGFAEQIPTFLLASVAGVLVDRWNRHRILVITQVLSMIQSIVLAVLALSGAITVGQIIGLSVLQGLVNAFDIPARQAFLIEMVEEKEDLGNAIALNSSLFHGARLIGPPIAGVIIALVNEGWCFVIDGISFLAVLVALLAMRLAQRHSIPPYAPVFRQLRDGIGYAFGFAPIRAILGLVALLSLAGMPYAVLMPVMVKQVLHGGAHTFGFMVGASGLGALLGALYLASRRSVLGLGRVIAASAGLFGAGIIAFAFSHAVWSSLALMLVTGFGMLVQMAASNTVLQTIVDDDKRGRIMSLYAMAFMGMMPFGSLLGGACANRLGAPATLVIGGGVCLVGAAAFARILPALRPLVRPIYIKKGILPGVVSSVQAVVSLETL